MKLAANFARHFRAGSLFLVVLMLAASLSQAAAQTDALSARLSTYNDLPALQTLQDKVADLIKANDRDSLSKLAESLKESDGPALDQFLLLGQRVEEKYPSDPAKLGEMIIDGSIDEHNKAKEADPDYKLVFSINSCQYANLVLRALTIQLAKGDIKAIERDGVVMIDESDLDTAFSENMYRCEIIRKARPPRPPRIGNLCLITGVPCLNDPDWVQ